MAMDLGGLSQPPADVPVARPNQLTTKDASLDFLWGELALSGSKVGQL
jgi:hypothetical protein